MRSPPVESPASDARATLTLWRARALLFTAASLLAWSCWYIAHRNVHPFGDLSRGQLRDHFSHMNAARLFMRAGADIWRKPLASQGRVLTPGEVERLPADLRPFGKGVEMRWIDGWPEEKPFFSSWVDNPRLYPPGDLLLVAPIAAAYHFTSLSFTAANRVLILYFLLLAHVSIYFALLNFSLEPRASLGVIGLFLLYPELIHWSLEGFYDVAMVAPLVLCASFLLANRGLAALVAYCAAAFIHFRAFFFAPFAVYASYLVLRSRPWRRWSARSIAAIVAVALLGGSSLYTFRLLWPTLRAMPLENPANPAISSSTFWTFAAIALVVAVILIGARAWLDLAIISWMAVMWPLLPYVFPWYMVALLPWVGAAVKAPSGRVHLVRDARAVFTFVVSALVCNYAPIPTWLRQL